MNMMKKNGGFTLVELIVVIAILAILAGVAVPAYSGYIGKAKAAADTTELAAVKTAAMGACATIGEVDKLEVKSGEVKVYVDGTDAVDYTLTYGSSDNKWTDSNTAVSGGSFRQNMRNNSTQIDIHFVKKRLKESLY